ncbi:HAMP domain-containing histidine kinase [Microcoleus sp. FACHB-1515]|nr:HAMP domain-containing histidine kinase [Microcoleus sp. FACHB-1515]
MTGSEDSVSLSEHLKDAEQQRLATLTALGLLESESVPIFEEATQTAARLLDAPICIFSLIDRDRQWFKSAVGLSRIGLKNELALSRQLPRQDSFCAHVIETKQVLAIADTRQHAVFADRVLTQRYGIRAYLGVPLIAADNSCLGTLAVFTLSPREFTSRDIELLELVAHWSISEFERDFLWRCGAYQLLNAPKPLDAVPAIEPVDATFSSVSAVKANLLHHMTQELRTPLTSILGMTSILHREIYGPLTDKQKKYMDIVHQSGQTLLSLVNEITNLGAIDQRDRRLDLNPVDVEMLCQQALIAIEQTAQCSAQQVRLTIEPGSRIWLLDKVKVRQMIYQLIFSVLQAATEGSTIRLHISRKHQQLQFIVWTSHPWLGEGLPALMLTAGAFTNAGEMTDDPTEFDVNVVPQLQSDRITRQQLSLQLSAQLAELHGGQLMLQGSAEEGYRYVVSLPEAIEMLEEA